MVIDPGASDLYIILDHWRQRREDGSPLFSGGRVIKEDRTNVHEIDHSHAGEVNAMHPAALNVVDGQKVGTRIFATKSPRPARTPRTTDPNL
jgi:hypothetical protein